jgi:predicted DNA repair protein MutK
MFKGRPREPRPPALPPETRTVGQLVAESVQLYRRRFWPSHALGLPIAVIDTTMPEFEGWSQLAYACAAGAVLITLAYIGGCAIAAGRRPGRRDFLVAYGLGAVIFVPFPLLAKALILPGAAWLALVGLSVPAVLDLHLAPKEAVRRGLQLAKVDYAHALGSVATLGITYFLTRLVLLFLLHGASETSTRTAAFVADLVLSPLLFLGAGLLYFDQAARLASVIRPRRPDADLHHAHDPDRPGRADPEGEPRPATGGQP